MPGIEHIQGFEPRTDQLSTRIQDLKARAAEGLEDAMNIVEQNLGRRQAKTAEVQLGGLAAELGSQEAPLHSLDAMRVAELISDPFEDA
ncbi:hypothetical protein [uncultured Pseudodesulfovibrio sp.]|uniref:hypothetical protein n=1 Tax=uncultured Pseudodesulfovibrio sp. TaxID=2035858 RepID=UPI0029C70CAE|nr:hypothetical protein [uncultured Pseudodesulfovibrio sp.]